MQLPNHVHVLYVCQNCGKALPMVLHLELAQVLPPAVDGEVHVEMRVHRPKHLEAHRLHTWAATHVGPIRAVAAPSH